jgi:hypothetical protein
VSHQLFREDVFALHHRLDCDGGVQVEGQSDDNGFDFVVVEKRLDPAFAGVVYLNVLSCLVFVGVLVLFDQSRTGWGCPIAVERAVNAVGANIGDRDDLYIFRGTASDQNATFVSGADDADSNRIREFFIAEVHRTQARAAHGSGRDDSLQKLASREADRFVKVILTDDFIFGAQGSHIKNPFREGK